MAGPARQEGIRRIVEIPQEGAFGLNGLLERYRKADLHTFRQGFDHVQIQLGELTGLKIPQQLIERLGLDGEREFELVDHPRCASTLWWTHDRKVTIEIERKTHDQGIGMQTRDFFPTGIRIAGKDIITGRPIALAYHGSEYEFNYGKEEMPLEQVDVGVTWIERPKVVDPTQNDYRIPAWTPRYSWRNIYLAGLVTPEMIDVSPSREPIYPLVVTFQGYGDDFEGEYTNEAGKFKAQSANTKRSVRVVFKPNRAHEGILTPWEVEVPRKLEKVA